MKKLITLLFLLCLGTTYAQVGIGTPLPNGSSQLDVVANDKGILIPRISLTSSTDATTISNGNVFSLLVFNTSTIQGDISPGYHYWDGSKWQRITNADDVVTLIEVNETLTSISQDIDAGTITYIDEDGGVTVLDIAQIIDVNETLTSLTDNGDGTITYIDEDGAATIIDLAEIIDNFETITNLVDNGDGTITYTNEEGTNQTINIEDIIDQFETVTTMVQDDTTGDITYTDEDGNPSVADIISDDTANIIIVGPDGGAFMDQAIIQNNETLTILELLIDGSTLQYTDEEGGITQIDLASIIDSFETLTVLGMNADGINLDYQDENGDITQVDLGAVITANETLTILVDNNDGTITYTDENGDDTVIDIATIIGNYETVTNLVDNGDGTITYTNEEGTNQTVDIVDIILQDIINQGDIYNEIINIINANTDIFVDNGDGTFTHTAADGTVVTFDANTTTMTNNGDGTYTFTNDNGDTITVDVIGDVVTNIQNQGDIYNEIINVINANSDVLQDNGDGTFTHTAADNTVISFDITQTGTGDPNGNGTTGAAGSVYVDESTGDVWTFDGTMWINQNPATNEPWFGADDNMGATENTEDIYSLGNVGIGTQTPSSLLNINTDSAEDMILVESEGLKQKNEFITYSDTPGDEPQLLLKHFRGVKLAPTATQDGDELGTIAFTGYSSETNGSEYGAQIKGYANGNFDGNTEGGYLDFITRENDASAGNENHTVILGNGNVGIGIDTPSEKLEVNGKVRVSDLTGVDLPTDVIVTADATTGELKDGSIASLGLDATDDAWINNPTDSRVELGTQSDGSTARASEAEVVVADNGNVGFGTNTPVSSLHIKKSRNYLSTIQNHNSILTISAEDGGEEKFTHLDVFGHQGMRFNTRFVLGTGPVSDNNLFAGSYSFDPNLGDLYMTVGDNPGTGNTATTFRALTIKNSGNVGIGTNTPNEKLEVNGKVRVSDLSGADLPTDVIVTADATTGELKDGSIASLGLDATDDAWINNPTDSRIELGTLSDGVTARPAGTEAVITDEGRMILGGTTLPWAPQDYVVAVGEGPQIKSANTNNTNRYYPFVAQEETAPGSFITVSGIQQSGTAHPTTPGLTRFHNHLAGTSPTGGITNTGSIDLSLHRGAVLSIRPTLDGLSGNVGIGTDTPNEKLEVNGKVRVSDLTGADLATDLIVTADITTGELKSATSSTIATTAAIRTETANYAVLADDATILIDATAGSVIVTLPTPVLGKKYVVKKIDATVNSMVLNGGGATIDGAATRTTTVPYQAFVLQNDGTNWFIIN